MVGIVQSIFSLAVMAGLVASCALIANLLFKRSSPVKRALIASLGLSSLMTLPGVFAILASDSPTWVVFTMPVGAAILGALFFPVAYLVTRRRPAERQEDVFD